MEHPFDAWTKALAGGISRREALRHIGGLVAALVASLGLGKAWGQNLGEDCDRFCQNRFRQDPAALQQCLTTCRACVQQGKTPCSADARGTVTCVNILTDRNNCGDCGRRCHGLDECCNGDCTNLQTDPRNCGFCGGVCAEGADCCRGLCLDRSAFAADPQNCGRCGHVCPADRPNCCPDGRGRGHCTNTQTDPDNCGRCGNECFRHGHLACRNGTCAD